MNRKGFTLIELIATIVVLSLVMSIAAYSITNILNKVKEKNYDLLIDQIKDASESYYQECRYAYNDDSGIVCFYNDGYQITLGDLIKYGFLKGNAEDNSNNLINPLNDENINLCEININFSDGLLTISNISSLDYCPTDYGTGLSFNPADISGDDRLKPTIPITPIKPVK